MSRACCALAVVASLALSPALAAASPEATPPPSAEPSFVVRLRDLEARIAELRDRTHRRILPVVRFDLDALERDTDELDGRVAVVRARLDRLRREMASRLRTAAYVPARWPARLALRIVT